MSWVRSSHLFPRTATMKICVYPKGDRPCWYAAFPDSRTGKRIFRVTDYRRDDPLGKRRAYNWARERAMESELNRSGNQAGRWEQWVTTWLRLKHRAEQQKLTLTTYLNFFEWLQDYFREKNIPTPRSLTYNHALDYIPWRMGQRRASGGKIKYNTALHELKFLSRVMREAIRRGYCEINPAAQLGLKKDKPAEKPEITDPEIVTIRAELQQREGMLPIAERWMTVSFEVALHQGCRHRETSLPLTRIDFERWTIQFHAKGGKIYTEPVHPALQPLLLQLKEAGATLTCKLPSFASIRWTQFFKGRKDKGHYNKGLLPHLCFHCTRVTVVTRLARAGVPIQLAMAYVHHADALIHKVYSRVKPADTVPCHAALAYPQASLAA